MSEPRKTPLHAEHQKLGARLIDFGGWDMPVQYSGIVDEHLCVRKFAGMFDISHMGEVLAAGPAAVMFLNRVLTNDASKLDVGQGHYTVLCNKEGGTIDDLYLYRLEDQTFLLIINASRIDEDVKWLKEELDAFVSSQSKSDSEVRLENASDRFGALAIQGPKVREFMKQFIPGPSHAGAQVKGVDGLQKNEIAGWDLEGNRVWVGCTGYTGEDGFEVVAPGEMMVSLWKTALSKGHAVCLQPCGLGARDTLRTEVCYPLYGHELDLNTTPLEAGLGFCVKLDKDAFNGRDRLLKQKEEGLKRRLVAFKMTGKSAPPRAGYGILNASGERIGEVTSGTQSPSLGVGIGLGYVTAEHAKPETAIQIDIRGRLFPAVVVKKPIYRKPSS